MRADRLLSIVMLLQARGQVSGAQLARELEVSERTIYRDIDALSAAGVPVYSNRGRDGGYALLDSYRTTLTGLTRDEARALFMLSVPAPLSDLGVSGTLNTAMQKLAAALPDARRGDEERVRQRIHLDSRWWFQEAGATPHLHALYRAVWEDRRVRIQWPVPYAAGQEIDQVVDAYGLVAKASVWHLVYAVHGRVRARRVSHLSAVEVLDQGFARPGEFALAAFWESWCAEFESTRAAYPVQARVAPHYVGELAKSFGEQMWERVARAAPPDAEGWITVELPFESLWEARARLLGLGRAVEVLEPEPLRLSIVDYARQIVDLYDG